MSIRYVHLRQMVQRRLLSTFDVRKIVETRDASIVNGTRIGVNMIATKKVAIKRNCKCFPIIFADWNTSSSF